MSRHSDENNPGTPEDPVSDAVENTAAKLKKQKRINKLTKLYMSLLRLILDEITYQEEILQCLEAFEVKKLETLEIIDQLISTYRQTGDEKNAVGTEEELDNVSIDADRDIASIKTVLLTTKISKISSPEVSPSKEKSSEMLKMRQRREQQFQIDELDAYQRNVTKEESEERTHHVFLPRTGTLEKEKIRQDGAASDHLPFLHKTPGEEGYMSNWQLPYTDKFIRTESNCGIDPRLPTIQIPKFKGDKTKFESFWAVFTTMIQSDEPPKYKMIRLKACLEGKAKEAIAKLGFSAEAYEEAKKTLKRKFGGDRRQIQNYLEELRKMAPLQERNMDEVEKFTDTLVNTVVMLKDQQRWSELERNSMLYTLVLEKITKPMLSHYFRWSTENHSGESLEKLRDWMVEETEYRVCALEIREGLTGKDSKKDGPDKQQHRSYSTIAKKE